MTTEKKLEGITLSRRKRLALIKQAVESFCEQHQLGELVSLAQHATYQLCRTGAHILDQESHSYWACGIMMNLLKVNGLFSRAGKLTLRPLQVSSFFQLTAAQATKSGTKVKSLLRIKTFSSEWQMKGRQLHSPNAWMIWFDGKLVDARMLSSEMQQKAFRQGLIPFLP
ncbi:MAG: DUF6398 domain-containing protein [Bacteroidota bacterium]